MKSTPILTILACGACIVLSPALRAQDAAPAPSTTGSNSTATGTQWGNRRTGGGGAGARGIETIETLTTALNLTDDEQTKIKPILDKLRTDIQAVRNDTTLAPQDVRAKVQPIRNDANKQIRDLLTPDQQTKFDALLAQMRNRRGQRGANGGGGAAAASPTP